MDYIFEVKDKTERKIHLPNKSWEHITRRHPYMTNFLDEVKETLGKPDKITNYSLDDNIRYYYKYYKNINFSNKYLLVIIKYLNGSGFVISSYFERHIK